VRWVPSIIRLYGEKVPNLMAEHLLDNALENRIERSSPSFNKKNFKSPRSIIDESDQRSDECNNKPIISILNGNQSSVSSNLCIHDSKYELAGIQALSLYKNDTFGGAIEEPSSIIFNAIEGQDVDLSTKELNYPQTKKIKRRLLNSFGKKRNMSEEAIEVHNDAIAYLKRNRVEDALELYENFLGKEHSYKVVDKQTENRVVGAFLHNIGVLQIIVGDFDLSVDFLRQAISYRDETLPENGKQSRKIAVTLNEMGIAYFASGQYEDALKVFTDVLSIWENIDGDESYEMTRVLNNIGCTYFVLNELNAALEAMSEALEIQRSFLIESVVKKIDCSKQIVAAVNLSLLGVSETMCNMAHLFFFMKSMEEVKFLLDQAALIHKTLFRGQCTKELLRLEQILTSMISDKPRSPVH